MSYTRIDTELADFDRDHPWKKEYVSHMEDGIEDCESQCSEINQSLTELDILGGSHTTIPDGDDLNNYTTPGKYNGSANIENIPYSMGFTMLIMDVRGSSNIIQIFFSVTSSLQTYMRLFNGTTWYGWLRISTVVE